MKYMALRNRLRALAERVPGPHAVLKIEGGLPPTARAKTEPSPAAAEPDPAEAKAAHSLKSSRK
jgi:hypothetical protein